MAQVNVTTSFTGEKDENDHTFKTENRQKAIDEFKRQYEEILKELTNSESKLNFAQLTIMV